jgi:hypothetical protein
MGRPPGKDYPIPLQMMVNEAFLASVDDWRDRQADKPSRAEAIRRMVAMVTGTKPTKRRQAA